jgi:hypothetical protein
VQGKDTRWKTNNEISGRAVGNITERIRIGVRTAHGCSGFTT